MHSHRPALIALLVLLAVSVSHAEEPSRKATDGIEPVPSGAVEAADTDGGSGRRPTPEAMVLCRGPRGAVYARDVAVGCRNVKLDQSNLTDFGAGDDCVLRSATSLDPDQKTTSDVRDCNEVCEVISDGRTCVVGLRRESKGWSTFPPEEKFKAGAPALRGATVVCCRG